MRAFVAMLVVLVGCGGGGRTGDASAPCRELARFADTADALRAAARAQLESSAHAMALWDQVQQQGVPEGDSGERAGAGERAQRYWSAGGALCQAAALVHAQMRGTARATGDRDVGVAAGTLEAVRCDFDKAIPFGASPAERQDVITELARRETAARAGEDALVLACHKKLGGARSAPDLEGPTPLLPTE